MKTSFHSKDAALPLSRKNSALTLMEMMVATTLLMLIVVGLTSMFMQTQRAFKAGLRQVDIFEGARGVMGMVTRDLEQASDARLGTNVYNLFTGYYTQPGINVQVENGVPFRTNSLQDLFVLSKQGNRWVGVGYAVSNQVAGVGTLYRFDYSTNRLNTNSLFQSFLKDLVGPYTPPNPNLPFTNSHRVAEGVIHLQFKVYDNFGAEVTNWPSDVITYPSAWLNSTNPPALPGYVEVELGILEPEVFEQARSMGANAQNFLSAKAGKVHIFRQQIPIRTASR